LRLPTLPLCDNLFGLVTLIGLFFSIFLPAIVSDIGYKAVYSDLMTVLVYATAYLCLLLTAYLCDAFCQRGIPITFAAFMSGIGYVLLGVLHNQHARLACTFLAVTVSTSSHLSRFSSFKPNSVADMGHLNCLSHRPCLDSQHFCCRHKKRRWHRRCDSCDTRCGCRSSEHLPSKPRPTGLIR
jgi:hypothetical protein